MCSAFGLYGTDTVNYHAHVSIQNVFVATVYLRRSLTVSKSFPVALWMQCEGQASVVQSAQVSLLVYIQAYDWFNL